MILTLAQVDGARRDLMEVITHGPSADDIVGLYTSFPWPSLCAEVAKLKIQLPNADAPVMGSGTPPIATPANTNVPAAVINIALTIAAKKSAANLANDLAATVATAGSDSSECSSRWPGLNRRPTVYETVRPPCRSLASGRLRC